MYYTELFSAFTLFLILGVLCSPFFSGCFFMLALFTLLMLFIIFFSLNFIWFLIIGIIIYLCGYARKYYKWTKLPELKEYLEQNPECKLVDGISCKNCHSDNLVQQGLFNQRGKLRFYMCIQCGSILFRFKVL